MKQTSHLKNLPKKGEGLRPPIRRVQGLYEALSLFQYFAGTPVFFIPEGDRETWYELVHERRDPLAIDFEDEHGGRSARERYNQQNMDMARARKAPVVRRMNGLVDYCVPVVLEGALQGFVITGAIQEDRMGRAELEGHFRAITGRSASEDPVHFSRYVRGVLNQPFVPRGLQEVFVSALSLVAEAVCGSQGPEEILREATRLRHRYFAPQYLHSGWLEALIWRKFHKMELELRAGGEATPWEKAVIGIHRTPSVVLAIMPGSDPRVETDHVDTLLAAQRLRDAAHRLARRDPDTISAGNEDFGALLLTSPRPGVGDPESRVEVLELAARFARDLERALRFPVHGGGCLGESAGLPLERSYHEAVQAMMWASYSKRRVVASWDRLAREGQGGTRPVELGRELVEALRGGSRAKLDTVRDLYWRNALSLCGRRMEPLRAHAQGALGIATYYLEREVGLEGGTVRALIDQWVSRIESTDDVERLGALFRKMIDEFFRLRVKPKDGTDRVTMERLIEDMGRRVDRPMSLKKAAASVGMSVPVFCRKFKAMTGRSLVDHMSHVRIEEAKRFLSTTSLTVAQIGRELGFSTSSYFIRVFQKEEGASPARYRAAKTRRAKSDR